MQDKTINPSLQMLLDIGRKMILDKGAAAPRCRILPTRRDLPKVLFTIM
ncbi:hypothetical protein LJK88_02280 [Paenibacillus sp. P26]|nr:hypothetical protein LJK88_02280 [Paenibacillus sp. P26]